MRSSITFDQLDAKVRELVAANPDYVYPRNSLEGIHYGRCVYNATEKQPSCIFGRAFTELGFPIPEEYEGTSIGPIMQDVLADADTLISDASGGWALLWADKMQSSQDNGYPWSEALRKADEFKAKFIEFRGNVR